MVTNSKMNEKWFARSIRMNSMATNSADVNIQMDSSNEFHTFLGLSITALVYSEFIDFAMIYKELNDVQNLRVPDIFTQYIDVKPSPG